MEKLAHEVDVLKNENVRVNEELRITRQDNALLRKKVESIQQENTEVDHRLMILGKILSCIFLNLVLML